MSSSQEQKIAKDQFYTLLYDKLIVCKKEIIALNQIISFFNGTNSDNHKYSDVFSYIQKNTQTLHYKIDELFSEIYEHQNNVHSFLELLIYVGENEEKIKRIIQKIGLMQRKMSQTVEDLFDQYIPKPAFQRRHSNKALNTFIEGYFEELYTKYTQTSQKSLFFKFFSQKTSETLSDVPLFIWGHRNNFRVYNTMFNEENHRIIENAYWHYEIPRIIPALAHELGHILQHTHIANQFFNACEKLLNTEKYSSLSILFLQKDNNEKHIIALEEFFGDFIAYNEFGDAYIFTLFYTTLPARIADLFQESFFTIPDIDTDEWRHFAYLSARIEVLIDYAKNTPSQYTAAIIKLWENLLGKPSIDIPFSLQNIFKNHYDSRKRYDEFQDIIQSTKNYIQEGLSAINFPQDNEQKYINIFESIWKSHFQNHQYWLHPKILREKLIEDVEGINENELSPYELSFIKLRQDISNNPNKDNLEAKLKSIFHKNYETLNAHSFHVEIDDGTNPQNPMDYQVNISHLQAHKSKILQTYGIFNFACLLPKKESISYKEIKENLFNQEDNNSSDPSHFYLYKIPLIKIDDIASPQSNTSGAFSLLLQLMLHHSSSNQDQSQSISKIQKGITSIKNTLKNHSYKLFKSLGPNDFVIYIPHITLDAIYEIKENFSQQHETFRRTYSVIGFEGNDPTNQIDTNDYSIVSKIRLKAIDPNTVQNQINTYKNKIIQANKTTGVTDLKIVWKQDITYNDILNFTKKEQDNIATDIQTFIEKNLHWEGE